METHKDIYIASDREIELQKKYGYPIDTIPYHISYNNRQINVSTQSRIKGAKKALQIRKNNKTKWEKSLLNWQIAGGKKQGSINAIKYGKAVEMYDSNDNLIKTFSNLKQAAKYFNTSSSNIRIACNDYKRSCKGYKWKWVNNPITH